MTGIDEQHSCHIITFMNARSTKPSSNNTVEEYSTAALFVKFLTSTQGTILLLVALCVTISVLILTAKIPIEQIAFNVDLADLLALILAGASIVLSVHLHIKSQVSSHAEHSKTREIFNDRIEVITGGLIKESIVDGSIRDETLDDASVKTRPLTSENSNKPTSLKQSDEQHNPSNPSKPNQKPITRSEYLMLLEEASGFLQQKVLQRKTDENLWAILEKEDAQLLEELCFSEWLSENEINTLKKLGVLDDSKLTDKGSKFIRSLAVAYIQYRLASDE